MQKERILNWTNINEVAKAANLDPIPLRALYSKSLDEDDGYLIVQYNTETPAPGRVIKRDE